METRTLIKDALKRQTQRVKDGQVKARLEYLRGELRAERISYGELAELQSLIKYIDLGDVELLEAAGVPETIEERLERFNDAPAPRIEAEDLSGTSQTVCHKCGDKFPDFDAYNVHQCDHEPRIEAEATARPWKIDEEPEYPLAIIADDDEGRHICQIGYEGSKRGSGPQSPFDEEQWANAALIVQAVNSHQALVDAVRSALSWMRRAPIDEIEAVEAALGENAPANELEAALALAEGKK